MGLPNEEDILSEETKAEKEAEKETAQETEQEDEVEIDIEDDTPEEDRGRKSLEESPEPTEDEIEEYSEKVKARIGKMRHGLHDERRAKEAALRERDEAVALAQRILKEKKELEGRNQMGESAYIAQAKERVALALLDAKRQFKEAYDAGDGEALAVAQERLSTLAIEKQQVENWGRQKEGEKKPAETTLQPESTVVKSAQPTSIPAPQPDEDAKNWAAKNKWFQKDKVMTAVAFAIHDELVESGVDPKLESSEYYGTLNKRMRDRFPDYEWGDPQRKTKSHSVVAPVTRTSKTAKRVVLTKTQVALANRLGLTLEQYAQELAKLET